MFRETRLGVKVGSHQECEFEEPTNIRNTNDIATSLVFFSGLVCFSVELAILLRISLVI
jgi:hypothetical protein